GRDERHRLPARQKRERIARTENESERKHEQRRQRPNRAPMRARLEVARRKHERGCSDQPEDAEKQSAEPVDTEAGSKRTCERIAEHALRAERPESRNGDACRADCLHVEPGRECPTRDAERPTEC